MARMTVQRRKDNETPRVFMHKIADIRGGVSVATSELGSDYLQEGTVLSAPDKGICHVVKIAEVVAQVEAEGVEVKVKKGQQFKVGDFVLAKENGKSATIAKIDTADKGLDVITLDVAIGKLELGDFIAEAAKKLETKAQLKYVPFAVAGTGKQIYPKSNLDVDAWLIGVTKGNSLPDFVASKLTGIINY